ncbi:hypothetical protein PF004_g13789 [Phytophthora fragariae]|uniref:FYVE-type domain-containing protein n=1 Tax=Phytophthora fragariae TaxID=53985 RepID=A0A6G0NRB3_9STRA|nr:hypothetical protein PF004_g13789 [Phytophthora fragariae]
MASCPSCRAAAAPGARACSQCGTRTSGSSSSVLSTRAVGSASTSSGIGRRNVPKDRNRKKKPKDKDREKPKDKEKEKPKAVEVPPAASGDEAASIYKRMLAAVRGANKDHDEVVAAFKADCKQYGQGELRARVFYERLGGYFGSELMLEHMLPQLTRLIPDDKKRKKLVKVHVKTKGANAVVTMGARGASHPRRPVSTSGRVENPPLPTQMRPSGDRRPYSASELIRRDSIESDSSSNNSGELIPVTSGSRLAMTRPTDNPKCAICSEVFEMKRRRHHCRKCGASVCHSCSPARMLISPDQVASESLKKKYDPAHPQRVCTICAPILQFFQDGLNSQYANCHKENPHEAKTRLHLPFSRSLESACRSAADILGNFFRPDFGADSDRYIPVNFLKRAQGIAFLTVIKAGLLITAKMGTGIVIAKLDDGSWSAPSAIGTAGIGGGLEGGGELIEVMIIMGSKKAVKVFHRTQVNVGGGLSVAVGPYGRDALAQAAASRGGFNANYSYSHSRGLFAGISLHGAVITARTEMNSNFYGQKLTPEEILSGSVPHPRAAQCLYDAIDQAMDGIAQFEASGGSQRQPSAATATQGQCSSCRAGHLRVYGALFKYRGVWSPEANAARQVPVDNDAVTRALAALPPAHVFRRDLLAYSTLRNLIPHPQLLPLHADEEERQGAASSEASASSNIYDVSEVEQISIKHWQLDDGNCRGLCFALPLSTKVRSVCLFNVGLNKEQLGLLCLTIPKTHVTALQLEWNPVNVATASETANVADAAAERANSSPSRPAASRPPSAPRTASRPPSAGATSKQHHIAPQAGDQEKELSEAQKRELSMQQELQAGDEEDTSEIFAQLLTEGSALVFLSLRANGITSRGAVALAKAVRRNKTLEALNLFQNSIGDAGARAFAHALPLNTTLKTLSLVNNKISGWGAKLLVDGLTKYAAPPELLSELDAAESQIQVQMDQAKKAKKKIDRATVIARLGLPALESIDGVQFAPGNSTLEELLLSGNVQLGPSDIDLLSEALDNFQPKLQAHLRCIKLQRLPKLHVPKPHEPQHVSEFIIL